MSLLPSLTNLFAVYDADPDTRARIAAAARRSDQFEAVTEPLEGWIVAWKRLPDSDTPGREFTEFHLAFAEGRDDLAASAGATDDSPDRADATWQKAARLADESPDRLDRLPGDFGFIRLRPRGGVTVARSCAGLVPFYVFHSTRRTAITTQLDRFVRFLPDDFKLDPLTTAIWSSGFGIFPDNRSVLQEVKVVPRGHFWHVEPGAAPRLAEYWDPRPDRYPKNWKKLIGEHADRFRELLLAKLDRELHPEGGNLLTLSGGIDSSSLCALATQALDKKIATWSMVPNREDLFEKEMKYIRPLIEHPNVERHWLARVGDGGINQFPPFNAPVLCPILHPALRSLPPIHDEWPVRVLFGGEWADELTGSLITLRDYYLIASPLRMFLEALRGDSVFGWKAIPRWIHARRQHRATQMAPCGLSELAACFAIPLQDEFRQWLRRKSYELCSDQRPWAFVFAIMSCYEGFTAMNWEALCSLGVRRSLPFVCRDSIELLYSCHPFELTGPGTKQLQRRGLNGIVPHRNLTRKKKGQRITRRKMQPPDLAGHSATNPVPSEIDYFVRKDWGVRVSDAIRIRGGHALDRLIHLQVTLGRIQYLGRIAED